jgi:hypothetical protein
VELDIPVAAHAHDVLHPQERGRHREEVRRHVIDLGETEAVVSALGRRVDLDAGEQRAIALPLHEAEERVTERCRDVEEGDLAAFAFGPLDFGSGRSSSLLQEVERVVRALDLEVHPPHTRRVTVEEALRVAGIRQRHRGLDGDVARVEDEGLLTQRRRGPPVRSRRPRRSRACRRRSLRLRSKSLTKY